MPDRSGRQYHLQCGPGDVGAYVLLPGDPGRVPLLAERLDGARPIAANREFTTWTGTLDGVPVSVTSTGIGGPSAAIAVEELCNLGAHTLVRVGTCGGMRPAVRLGDVVVVQAAVRDEGTSHQYVPAAWPAVAHLDVVDALRDAARGSGAGWHAGVVQSKDSFYAEMDPDRMPASSELLARAEAWRRIGVLASEMECAAVLTVAATRGVRAGAVLGVVNATPAHEGMPRPDELPTGPVIDVAVAAMRTLVRTAAGST